LGEELLCYFCVLIHYTIEGSGVDIVHMICTDFAV